MKKTVLFSALVLLFGLSSCSDDDSAPSGTLRLHFFHRVDGQPLELESKRYINAAGNEYSISEFNYYISNLKLRNRSNGNFFIEPESYHLIRSSADNSAQEYILEITGIPAETYTEVDFSIGVDNAANYSIDHIGDLDPFNNNMVWDWNTGYKFLLLEGRFYPESNAPSEGLVLHIGGDFNYKTLSFNMGSLGLSSMNFSESQRIDLEVDVEISNIFTSPTDIDFREQTVIMFESISANVAENYATDVFILRTN